MTRRIIDIWLAVSESVTAAKQELTAARESAALDAVRIDEGFKGVGVLEPVKGEQAKVLMREAVERELAAVVDRTVETLYAKPTIGGRQYTLQSLNVDDDGRPLEDHVKELMADYPGEVLLLGAWDVQTGERLIDLHPDAWRVMPDRIEHDKEGQVIATIPAISNADLRDVCVLYGQHPRNFA